MMTDKIYTDQELEEQESSIEVSLTPEDEEVSAELATELTALAEPAPRAANDDLLPQLYQIINQVRAQYGKGQLRPNAQLQRAAQYHSNYMANHNCFSHQCAGEARFIQRIRAAGYRSGAAGETIGAGQRTAQSIVNAWLKSPPHKKILLGNYVHMGGGYAYRAGRAYWTCDFASPARA